MQHHLEDFSGGRDSDYRRRFQLLLDKKNDNPITKKATVIKEIEHLCCCNNLIDIRRQLKHQIESFTWRNKSHKIQCRLDFFLISEKLADFVASCKIFHAPETDHYAISLHLQAKIKQQIKLEAQVFKYESIDDEGLKWDLIKMEKRGFTVKYAKSKAKRRKNDEVILQNKINEL